jgi:AraC-like DNA-binding protein
LRPFVEHFWTQAEAAVSPSQSWRIPPDANPYLIFTVWQSPGHDFDIRCMLVGSCSRFLDIPVSGRIFTCGIRFRPGVLPLLARLPAFELTNGAATVEEVFGARGRRLNQRMGELASWQLAPGRLAEFLGTELADCDSFQALPIHCAGNVGGLAEATGCSTRTLHHRVMQQVGFAPKRWLRIERLHRVLRLSMDRTRTWSDIAAHCGFADQAHMVREFTDLLGETPTAWSKRAPFLPPSEIAAPPGRHRTSADAWRQEKP